MQQRFATSKEITCTTALDFIQALSYHEGRTQAAP
jgi:hypothetical protein